MGCSWEQVVIGRTGLRAAPIGVAASYGVGERDVEHAFERGVGVFYWGSRRSRSFGRGLKAVARRDRARVVTVVQTYTRAASLMRPSLELALRSLGVDHTDVLLLGWWNSVPPRRILDAAAALKASGKAKAIMVSCHHRPTFADLASCGEIDAIMVRYNAAHPGAETEVFPSLGNAGRAGVVAYTATRWGHLVNPRLTPAGEKTPRGSDCYRFCLTHPSVDLVMTGPRDRAELDEALAALDRGPMSVEELAWMKRVGRGVRGASEGSRPTMFQRAREWVLSRSSD